MFLGELWGRKVRLFLYFMRVPKRRNSISTLSSSLSNTLFRVFMMDSKQKETVCSSRLVCLRRFFMKSLRVGMILGFLMLDWEKLWI